VCGEPDVTDPSEYQAELHECGILRIITRLTLRHLNWDIYVVHIVYSRQLVLATDKAIGKVAHPSGSSFVSASVSRPFSAESGGNLQTSLLLAAALNATESGASIIPCERDEYG
jgi:hypothetical protein